jgi:hypothetical protein
MTSPRHHSIATVTDPHPVRPGTSAALTARTIDATVHPPIVRAQEAVAAFIPRVEAPLRSVGSPILLGMFGATLVLLLVAHRARFRPSALVFSAMLMMMLTSFRPVTKSASASSSEPLATADDLPDQATIGYVDQQDSEPANIDDDQAQPEMTMPDVQQPDMPMPEVREPDMLMPRIYGPDGEIASPTPPTFEISPDLIARVIPPAALMRLDQAMMQHDRDKLRASLEELEIRVRKEARRNARRYYRNW